MSLLPTPIGLEELIEFAVVCDVHDEVDYLGTGACELTVLPVHGHVADFYYAFVAQFGEHLHL